MLASISARQLREWEEFFALEPWGEQRADWRTAQIAHILATVHRDPKKPPFKLTDFMWDQRTPTERARDQARELKRGMLEREMKQKALALAQRQNGGG